MRNESNQDVFEPIVRGITQTGVRLANERAVLSLIAGIPGVSNADIARLSGLAPQTVSAILTDLEAMGLIARGEVLRGRRGQPATPISLNPEGACSIGNEIGWRNLDVLLLSLDGQELARRHRDQVFPDATSIVDDIMAMMGEVLAGLPDSLHPRLTDIGVAMPTNIAGNLGLVEAPDAQVELWERLDLAGELARRTGIEVTRFNDGTAACWGELIAFPRPRPSDFIYS